MDTSKLQEQLASSESRFLNIIYKSGDPLVVLNLNGIVLFANEAAERLFARPNEQIVGEYFGHPVLSDAPYEIDVLRPNGREVCCEMHTVSTEWDEKPAILAQFRDITERKQTETYLRLQTSAMDAATDMIFITDAKGRVIQVNKSFEIETGHRFTEVFHKTTQFLAPDEKSEGELTLMWKRVLSGNTWRGEINMMRRDGSQHVYDMSVTPVLDETGRVQNSIAIMRNVTDKKQTEEKLNFLAHHDPLTGLPNRVLFMDRLRQRISLAKRKNEKLAVMFLDLDRFKEINDSLGHKCGDTLLQIVSDRLQECLRESDTIARMGGDEFTILLSEVASQDDAHVVARRCLDCIAEPMEIEGTEIIISASLGIAMYPDDSKDASGLLKAADISMYRAKEQGRNHIQCYTAALDTHTKEKMSLATSLRRAIQRKELVLHYQPRVGLKSGEPLGVEALVRWQHPDLGLLGPNKFIHIAEEAGLISPIFEWVLQESCTRLKEWHCDGYTNLNMAVNISARQFVHEDLVHTISDVIDDVGIEPKYLNLELTESALVEDPEKAIHIMKRLKDMDVRLAIDDFGTGYSSLNYLKQFPLDSLKIARVFVHDITTNPEDAAIASAIIAMGHSLWLRVVAEGVETPEQLNLLSSLKCDEVQGFLFARPVSAEELPSVLNRLIKENVNEPTGHI